MTGTAYLWLSLVNYAVTVIVRDMDVGMKVISVDGEPWFVGKDVAVALGYEKPRNAIETHVDKDDALKWGVTDSIGRTQQMTIINESGLYSLIFGSKLENISLSSVRTTSDPHLTPPSLSPRSVDFRSSLQARSHPN